MLAPAKSGKAFSVADAANYNELRDGFFRKGEEQRDEGWISNSSAKLLCALFACTSVALAAVTGAMYFGAIKTKSSSTSVSGSDATPAPGSGSGTAMPTGMPFSYPATKLRIMPDTETTVYGVNGYSMPDRLKITGDGPAWQCWLGGACGLQLNHVIDFNVQYINLLPTEATIIHPHGLLPPVGEDGVPFLAAPPIYAKQTRYSQYDLPPRSGTHFGHSHYNHQHGRGLAIPIIVKEDAPVGYPLFDQLHRAEEVVLMIDSFCPYSTSSNDTNPTCNQQVIYDGLAAGYVDMPRPACDEPSTNYDVAYRALLINGQSPANPAMAGIPRGAPVRLRVINGCSMAHLKLFLPVDMTVVAVDGEYAMPWATNTQNNTFWLATAQRVDFYFTMPDMTDLHTGLVFRAVNENVKTPDAHTDQLQAIFVMYVQEQGSPPQKTYSLIIPDDQLVAVIGGYPGNMKYNQELFLHAYQPLVPRPVDRSFVLEITGDNGFQSINHTSYQLYPMVAYKPNPNPLVVHEGDRVQITIINNNADGHALHLHGHSFQIVALNGHPVDGPMRDTAFVPGGLCNSVTFQFDANNPGVWPLHCHMDFHMMAGMMTTVEYQVN